MNSLNNIKRPKYIRKSRFTAYGSENAKTLSDSDYDDFNDHIRYTSKNEDLNEKGYPKSSYDLYKQLNQELSK